MKKKGRERELRWNSETHRRDSLSYLSPKKKKTSSLSLSNGTWKEKNQTKEVLCKSGGVKTSSKFPKKKKVKNCICEVTILPSLLYGNPGLSHVEKGQIINLDQTWDTRLGRVEVVHLSGSSRGYSRWIAETTVGLDD